MENAGTVQRQRRNDRIETRAVAHTCVDHRAGLIHTASYPRDDPIDDLHQVIVVAEHNGRFLHAAATFDIDILGAVDEDIADRRVVQQQFERSEPERFVEHFADELVSFRSVQQRGFGVAKVLHNHANLAAQHIAFEFADLGEVEFVDQLAMDPLLHLIEIALFGVSRSRG